MRISEIKVAFFAFHRLTLLLQTVNMGKYLQKKFNTRCLNWDKMSTEQLPRRTDFHFYYYVFGDERMGIPT